MKETRNPYLFQHLLFTLVVSARTHHEVEVPFLRAVRALFGLDGAETGIDIALVAEPAPEEPPDAFYVAIEVPETVAGSETTAPQLSALGKRVDDPRGGRGARWGGTHRTTMHAPFCILVRRADHLREVDDDRLPAVPSDEDVELVEVAVDEPRTREAHDEVHERRVQRAGGRHVGNLAAETQARGEPNRRRHTGGGQGVNDRLQGICVDELHEDAVPGLVDGPRHGEGVLVQDLETMRSPLRARGRARGRA